MSRIGVAAPAARRRMGWWGTSGWGSGWRATVPRRMAAGPVAVLVLLLILGGCERKQTLAEAFPEPITPQTTCAVDGMLLLNHPGPKGQIVHTDGTRTFYCDVREALEARHDPENGHTVAKVYVQPLDGHGWEARTDGWEAADGLYFVLGSGRMGHMGPTAVPFRERAAAEAFVAAEGGRLLAAADLTGEVVAAYAQEVRSTLRGMQMGARTAGPAMEASHPHDTGQGRDLHSGGAMHTPQQAGSESDAKR